MNNPVYIWRGGLRHWESCGEGYIALADGGFVGPRPPEGALELVDADIYSGATMLKLARALRAAGCPPQRISVELGPILPDTVDDAVAIARVLAEEGLVSYLTYRGASIGQYGDYSAAIADLKARGFFTEPAPYTYDDGKGNQKQHEYYLLKNYLAREVEDAFLAGARSTGLRLYRHTGHMYAREWGLKVAISRNNRVREEMLPYARAWSPDEFAAALRTAFGLDCPVEPLEAGPQSRVFRLHRRGTEDVAHAVGAETQTAVLFDDYSNLPSMADLEWYFTEGWLARVNEVNNVAVR